MRALSKQLMIVFPVALLALAAPGTDYFVSTNGNNGWDGLSWATAKRDIPSAISLCADGGTVTVSNGVYTAAPEAGPPDYRTHMRVTNSILVQSVNGPDVTFVDSNYADDGYRRALVITASATGAVVRGFTMMRCVHSSDAAVYIATGRVENCIIRFNRTRGSTSMGGGVYMAGGTLRNCLVMGNEADASGGGGVYMVGGVVENCTIVGNRTGLTGGGLFMSAGEVRNTIVHYNFGGANQTTSYDNVRKTGGTFHYSCSFPLVSGGSDVNNTDRIPEFTDPGRGHWRQHVQGSYTLQPGSPCIDTGTNQAWMATTNDFAGNPRQVNGTVDMGAYESLLPSAGPLRCGFTVSTNVGLGTLSNVVFTGYLSGSNMSSPYYAWDFGNGSAGGLSLTAVTNHYSAPGLYTVRLTVTNAALDSGSYTRAGCVAVHADVGTIYVAPAGSHQLPFGSWATAATNLEEAIRLTQVAMSLGATNQAKTVLVTNGVYALLQSVRMTQPMTVRAINRLAAVVDALDEGPCFYMNHANAVLDGLTIIRGWIPDATGGAGGAWIGGSGGKVLNCALTNNMGTYAVPSAVFMSSGAGVVSNAFIAHNTRSTQQNWCGALYMTAGLLVDSTVVSNLGLVAGMRADGGTVRNCLIAGNTGQGSAVMHFYGSPLIESCTITRNEDTGHNAAWQQTGVPVLKNCIVYHNKRAANSNANIEGSLITNNTSFSCVFEVPHDPAGTGNITNEPGFRLAGMGYGTTVSNFNFRLHRTSPCIGAGTNQAWMALAFDLEGKRRILRSGGVVDIGAYEWEPPTGSIFVVH